MENLVTNLSRQWRNAGVQEGDLLLLHSDIRHLLYTYMKSGQNITPEIVYQSFLQALGDTGTLLLPTFNFDFSTHGSAFDIRKTPSQMGTLTNIGLNSSERIRTGHPVYSIAAVGQNKSLFSNVDNFSAYGADSPFGILHRQNGKIASLGLPDQHSMTFYHYVEEMNNVPYRYHKTFTGLYVDAAGHQEKKSYSIFVRNLELGVETFLHNAEDLLWKKGVYKGHRYNQESGLRTTHAEDFYNTVSSIIQNGNFENMLMRYNKESR